MKGDLKTEGSRRRCAPPLKGDLKAAGAATSETAPKGDLKVKRGRENRTAAPAANDRRPN